MEERRALRRDARRLGSEGTLQRGQARARPLAAHLPRRDGADGVRHPEAQAHHAQGDRRAGARWPDGQARTRAHARDDRGLLHDVRRALPVRRRLDRRRGQGPGASARAVEEDERQVFQRREQRRPPDSLGRSGVQDRRRARSLAAAPDLLRCQQRRARGAGGRLHPVWLVRPARARQRRQYAGLEAGGHRDLPGIPCLRDHLAPDVGRAAGRGGATALSDLHRQLRDRDRSKQGASSAR